MDIVGRFLTTPSSDGNLRAELWADALLKILCWIPLALGGAVFGVDIFVFRLECFPIHPTSAVTANAGNDNGSAAGAFKQPGPYSSQMDEFVNAYCRKQTSFDYRVFTLMLVAQSLVMFLPHLVWDQTKGKKVICDLRFIRQYLEVWAKYLEHEEQNGNDISSEKKITESSKEKIQKFVEKLLGSNEIFAWYLAKQVSIAIFTVLIILAFGVVKPASGLRIQDDFNCTVSQDLTVFCTVSSASLHRIVWWTNILLLVFTGVTVKVHMVYLCYALWFRYGPDNEPFSEIDINIGEDTEAKKDCHLMHAFLKANIDSIEKYNYVKILHELESDAKKSPDAKKSAHAEKLAQADKPTLKDEEVHVPLLPVPSQCESPV
ncbi:uncharacterized protein LOC144927945 [Branchiostoma floridae x Branchiostoma belcheri]